MQWLTPTNGLLYNSESVLAMSATDCKGPPIPGPSFDLVNKLQRAYEDVYTRLAFRVTNTIQITERDLGLVQAFLNDFKSPFPMMQCCVARLKTFSRRSDVGMSDIG